MRFNTYFNSVVTALLLAFASSLYAAEPDEDIVIYAAASLTNAVTEIAKIYQNETQTEIKTSFASSSTLAKQIENGAPADIFISADTKWMRYLKDKKTLNEASIANLLTNHLVLIVPKGKQLNIEMNKSFDFFSAFNGKLCTGEMESVPVGIYAKQALNALGWLDAAKSRIVGTQDVRAALRLVERGECAVGIVYETDAKISNKVDTIASFPDNTHEQIVYPLSLTKGAGLKATAFYNYLKSDKAKLIFTQYGFSFTNLNN